MEAIQILHGNNVYKQIAATLIVQSQTIYLFYSMAKHNSNRKILK